MEKPKRLIEGWYKFTFEMSPVEFNMPMRVTKGKPGRVNAEVQMHAPPVEKIEWLRPCDLEARLRYFGTDGVFFGNGEGGFYYPPHRIQSVSVATWEAGCSEETPKEPAKSESSQGA